MNFIHSSWQSLSRDQKALAVFGVGGLLIAGTAWYLGARWYPETPERLGQTDYYCDGVPGIDCPPPPPPSFPPGSHDYSPPIEPPSVDQLPRTYSNELVQAAVYAGCAEHSERMQQEIYQNSHQYYAEVTAACGAIQQTGYDALWHSAGEQPGTFSLNREWGSNAPIITAVRTTEGVYSLFFEPIPADEGFTLVPSEARLLPGMLRVDSITYEPYYVWHRPQLKLPALVSFHGYGGSGSASAFVKLHQQRHGGYYSRLAAPTYGGYNVLIESDEFGMYDDAPYRFTFAHPDRFIVSANAYSSRPRAATVEAAFGIRPVYFAPACGELPTYGDAQFWVTHHAVSFETSMLIDINFPGNETLHVTTAQEGYAPEEWGTIKSSIKRSDFLRGLNTTDSGMGKTSRFETIGGLRVKHTEPFLANRSCQGARSIEQFQAIHPSGAVISFTFSEHQYSQQQDAAETSPLSKVQKDALIATVLSTFQLQ